MASDYTVGDLVAEFLSQCGVTTAFGIASVHNIPMLDAIGRRNAIRFMMARGELGGAHMADGYARVSGSLGVIFSSTGPGAANAIGGLIEARFSGSSVLHITGQTSTKFVDRDRHCTTRRISSPMLGQYPRRVSHPVRPAGHRRVDPMPPWMLTSPTGPVSVGADRPAMRRSAPSDLRFRVAVAATANAALRTRPNSPRASSLRSGRYWPDQ